MVSAQDTEDAWNHMRQLPYMGHLPFAHSELSRDMVDKTIAGVVVRRES